MGLLRSPTLLFVACKVVCAHKAHRRRLWRQGDARDQPVVRGGGARVAPAQRRASGPGPRRGHAQLGAPPPLPGQVQGARGGLGFQGVGCSGACAWSRTATRTCTARGTATPFLGKYKVRRGFRVFRA